MRKMDYFSGRSDNMVKLRGTNVWPEAVGVVATEDEQVSAEYFVTVERIDDRDEMTVQIESMAAPGEREAIAGRVADRLRSSLGVRINVTLVGPGDLEGPTGRGIQGKPKRFEDRRPGRAAGTRSG